MGGLPFCPNCGAEVSPQNKFCPSCGAQLAMAASAPARSGTERRIENQKPAVERLLSGIQMGLGVILLVLGVLLLLTPVLGFAVFFVVVGLVSLAAGYGLWKQKSWARSALTLSGIFYLVLGIVLVLPLSGWLAAEGALSITLGAFSMSWARSSRIRSRFGGRS